MAGTTPKAIEDCHDLLKWLIPQLDKFPRQRRFTLGDRMESQVGYAVRTIRVYGAGFCKWYAQHTLHNWTSFPAIGVLRWERVRGRAEVIYH